MPGTFSKSNRPRRSGSYTNFVVAAAKAVAIPLQGVVALAITHDWGPFETVVDVNSPAEFEQIYGKTNTEGSRAVFQAFKGESVDGIGGAAQVKLYRFGGSAAAKAARTISNTTPASAVTITARYEGTRGNGLKTQVVADATNPSTHHNLIVSDSAGELERYVYVKTDIADLVSKVNASSDWITAAQLITGVALGVDGAAVALTAGNDGTTVVAGDWTDVRNKFDNQRFSVFVGANLSDATLHAAFKTWVQDSNAKGKRFLLVLGATANTAAQAITDAATFNDENVALWGGGTLADEDVLDTNNNPITLTPALFAPRVAGVVAARGESASISFARLGGVSVVAGPTATEVQSLIDGGVVTFDQDSDADAPVRIEQGTTTYISDTAAKPRDTYGVIKSVRTMHGIELEFGDYQTKFVIGKLPVDNNSRETLVGAMHVLLQRRVDAHIVHDKPTVEIDNDPPPSDSDNFIQLKYGVKFTEATEKVFNTIYVG